MNITTGILSKKILKNWLIIIIITVLLGCLGFVYAQFFTPKAYMATATGSVNYNNNAQPVTDKDYERFMSVINTQKFNEYFLNHVSTQGDGTINVCDIDGSVEITVLTKMNHELKDHVTAIQFTSIYDDPEVAYEMLFYFTQAIEVYLVDNAIFDDIKVSLQNVNIAPKDSTNINDDTVKDTILGLAIGLIFSVLGVIIYVISNRGLKSVISFKEEFDIQVLGTIDYESNDNKDDNEPKLRYNTVVNKLEDSTPEDRTTENNSCASQKEDKDE